MEWGAFGIAFGWAAWEAYKIFFAKKDNNHDKLDKTKSEIISAYETRIKQLEDRHDENESRITALEKSLEEQSKVMKKQEQYIQSLVELVQGRDPEIQSFMIRGIGALDLFEKDTAPKVSEIHKHFTKVAEGGE